MYRRKFVKRGSVVAVSLLTGCLHVGGGQAGDGGGGEVEQTSEVSMVNTQFQPRNIHVDTGTTVTWTNDDSFPHTVTSASDNWDKDTEVQGGGQTTHTFEESGVYEVDCTIHSGMSMKIGVGDASIQDPLGGGGGGTGGDGGYGY